MSNSRRLTDAEREQRRQADRDRLERAARELLSSDGWARWIRVRASTSLGRYSLRNQWILSSEAAQRGITPTHVAGFRAWLAVGRVVTKGQKAIYILAPMTVKQRNAAGEETGEKRVFYRSVPVFDASQTEPLPGSEPIPLSPPREPITGESHTRLLDPLGKLAGELGYTVRELPLHGSTDGWCDSTNHDRDRVELARYAITGATRVIYGQRMPGRPGLIRIGSRPRGQRVELVAVGDPW